MTCWASGARSQKPASARQTTSAAARRVIPFSCYANAWTYRHAHVAAERMVELARRHPDATGLTRRALNQAARELMLAQSSDWAFIMKAGTCVDYAVERTKNHISRFNRLYDAIRSSDVDHELVSDLESMDNIFPDIDYTIYSASPMASAILDT